MKKRIRIRRRDGIRQRYWVGRKRNYGSDNLNAKEFTFVKDGKEVTVKDYEVNRINQLMLQGYRIKKNYGSHFKEKDDLLRTLKYAEEIDTEAKIINPNVPETWKGTSWERKLKKKNLGSFTALGISKQQNIERIKRLNERRKWARELYTVDNKLKTAIEGGQRESLEKEREDLSRRIGESLDKYGRPVFIQRKNYGSYNLDRPDDSNIQQ